MSEAKERQEAPKSRYERDLMFCKFAIASLPVGILTVDSDLKITGFNPWAERITGYAEEEVLGRYCGDVLRGAMCGVHCPLRTVLRREKPMIGIETTIQSKAGQAIPVRMNTAGLFDHEERLIGGIESFQDIRPLKKLERERNNIIFHGDHVPLADANPYQLALQALPPGFSALQAWSLSPEGLSPDMRKRFQDLADLLGTNLQMAEGRSIGPLSFSRAVPHGRPDSPLGNVMMTRIQMGSKVFVHASDIQLLHEPTVEQVVGWGPDIVLAGGPPLYLERLERLDRERAWEGALRLAQNIEVVILDHHLLRSEEGTVWLDLLSEKAGRRVYCAADFMGRDRQLLEAGREQLYEDMPVSDTWHEEYAKAYSAGVFTEPIVSRMQ